jgi:hypothetical protein
MESQASAVRQLRDAQLQAQATLAEIASPPCTANICDVRRFPFEVGIVAGQISFQAVRLQAGLRQDALHISPFGWMFVRDVPAGFLAESEDSGGSRVRTADASE